MKPFFLLLLLCTNVSFAATYKLSCTANFSALDLKTQLSLRNLTLNPENPDFDICFQEKTETYSVPNYYNSPQFSVGYGQSIGNNGFGGVAFDPFFMNDYNGYYSNSTQTTSTVTLTIKDRQGTTAWQDSFNATSSKNNSQVLRTLVSRIPISLAASVNIIETTPLPEHVYSSKDFEKKQLTPEEFEQIRLR